MMALLFALQAEAGVVATTASPELEAAYRPRRVAVLVGVQDYDDPALKGLKFPEKDARDLGAVLGSAGVGGFDRVFVIAGHDATTREGLLRSLGVVTADLQRDDTFVLYLSGHGTLTLDPLEGSQLWFLPSDGRLDRPEASGLAVREIEALVHELPARRRVLILDTCHNGRTGSRSAVSGPTQQLLSGFRGEVPAPRDVRDISESEARLYAAQYWQPAMEDPALENGVYTHFLIDALTESRASADLDEDGLVDVAEAHQHARDRTMAWTGGLQVPRAEYRIVGREEIFLAGADSLRDAAERALIAACDAILARARLFVNGTPRGELPGLYAIDPGVATIEVQTEDGRTLLRDRVRVEAGETLPLEDLVARKATTLAVLGGVAVSGGNDALFPVASSARLVLANPVRLAGPWRSDLHVGASLADGANPVDGVSQTTGDLVLGVTAGPSFGPGWAGAFADLHLPYRWSGYERQSTPGAAAGLALGVDLPLGGGFVATRLEGWAGGYQWNQAWTEDYGGTLSVGFGAPLAQTRGPTPR
ncbi:MAG: caspase family protein [Deltaproteobacteria bacterium]|nr:caspase family protein [Deltaproteobacteria bacterium]